MPQVQASGWVSFQLHTLSPGSPARAPSVGVIVAKARLHRRTTNLQEDGRMNEVRRLPTSWHSLPETHQRRGEARGGKIPRSATLVEATVLGLWSGCLPCATTCLGRGGRGTPRHRVMIVCETCLALVCNTPGPAGLDAWPLVFLTPAVRTR